MKTLGDRLNAASQAIPASTTTITDYQDITQQNAKTRYPNIKYWTKADYSGQGKEKKNRSDILEVGKGKPLRGNARMRDGHIGALHCAEWFDSKNTTVCRRIRIPGIPGILECTYRI